jgi:hypothetical protein
MVNTGVYRSVDGGNTFTPISGTLPQAGVTQLLADPTNANTFYAALGTAGIFRSDNGGLTWVQIDNGAANGVTTLATAQNVLLAISHGTITRQNQPMTVTALYAAVVGPETPTDPNSPLVTTVFRSTDATSNAPTWAPMDMPGTTKAGFFVGLTPNGDTTKFSFVADPANPDIIYIGGETQPDTSEEVGGPERGTFGPANEVGATAYTGRLFRGDASQARGPSPDTPSLSNQWTPITDRFAEGTGPHSDSRSLIIAPNGSLIETDDGGVYRLSDPNPANPTNAPNPPAGPWTSLNGNLRVSEFIGISYDPLNRVLLGGTQDNGTPFQSADGNPVWDMHLSGDGGYTLADVFPGTTTTLSAKVDKNTPVTTTLTVASAAGFPTSIPFTSAAPTARGRKPTPGASTSGP